MLFKKPSSSFTKFLGFMVVFFGIIGALFTVFSLNDPDVMKNFSNVDPGTIFYYTYMICIYSIVAVIGLMILSYLLFHENGSTMFWLFIHFILLLVCSPYFLIVLIWGTITFLTTKSKTESSSKKYSLELDDINVNLKENGIKGFFSKFGKPKTDAERKVIAEEKKRIEEEKKRIAEEKKRKAADEKGKEKKFSFNNIFGKKEEELRSSINNLRIFGGGGDEGDKKSSLERFIDILLEKDHAIISLWDKLLGVYYIQDLMLKTYPATLYK